MLVFEFYPVLKCLQRWFYGGDKLRLLAVIAVVAGLDQLTKYLIVSFMNPGETVAVIPRLLYLTHVQNPGAAFGLMPYRTILFIAVTLIVMVFMLIYYRALPKGFYLMRLGLALQLGGALGNLVDRLRFGQVIDFIDLKFFPPVFNLADSAIVIGVGLFIIAFWRLSPFLERSP